MSYPRKIYVEEGEMVEIRVVPKGETPNAAGFREHLRPDSYKFLAKIGAEYFDLCVPQRFCFKMDGKAIGYHEGEVK